jgi:glutathione S-transferase
MGFPAAKEVLAKYKNLIAYITRMMERPSFKSTEPPPRK